MREDTATAWLDDAGVARQNAAPTVEHSRSAARRSLMRVPIPVVAFPLLFAAAGDVAAPPPTRRAPVEDRYHGAPS
jgi:hypothetical protein